MMTESKMYDDLVETFQGVKWTNIIDNLTPTSTLTIDPKISEFSETFLESGCEKFMGMVKRAVFTIMKQKYIGIDIPVAIQQFFNFPSMSTFSICQI